jgi:hypothetical protein
LALCAPSITKAGDIVLGSIILSLIARRHICEEDLGGTAS